MSIFQSDDKQRHAEIGIDGTEIHFYTYRVKISDLLGRLRLFGVSLDSASIDYTKGLNYNKSLSSYNEAVLREILSERGQEYTKSSKVDVYIGFEEWNQIIKNGLDMTRRGDEPEQSSHLHYLLNGDIDGGLFQSPKYLGYFGSDFHLALYSIIKNCQENDYVSIDYTDLVDGGYYDSEDDLCAISQLLSIEEYSHSSKILVLTEGSTDKIILERCLCVLYPHLKDYFYFLDFSNSNAPGGADHLVKTVKAFSAAGIPNRILALFDNDAAASEHMRGLMRTELSPNIIVMQLPEIAALRNYPTIGPQGQNIFMDVNGLAGGIELYLGKDALKNHEGELIPVHWKGYMAGVQKYQGEVQFKQDIQRRFFNIIKAIETDVENKECYDLSGIEEIFESIFHSIER